MISGEVRLPGSKSLSNRVLLLAALADGTTTIENLLVRYESLRKATNCENGIYCFKKVIFCHGLT
jgi:5-enolpyruvylshikimate-3-phosphate synthase